MKLGLTEHAAEPEQQAVVVVTGVVDAVSIGDQGPNKSCEIEQDIPVGVASKAARFVGQHQANATKGDLGDQFLETSALGVKTGVGLVTINDVNPLRDPAQGVRAGDQSILVVLAFAVV